MKKFFSFFLIGSLLLTTQSFAQGTSVKAKTIMDKVSNHLKKGAGSLTAQFTLSAKSATGKEEFSQSGKFYLKGNKYKIALKGGQEIITDAKSIWTYLPGNKEVQISTYDPNEQVVSPAQLFSGSYEKDYFYSYSGSKTVSGKKVEVITLRPKKTSLPFSRVLLYINPSTNMVTGGQVYDRNGSIYVYSISNVNTSTNLSDNLFKFDSKAHPGTEVIDLR